MARRFLTLALLALAACSESFAAAPENLTNADQYMRIGGSGYWARQWSPPTSAGTAGLVLETPGDNSYTAGDPHLFLWGTAVRIDCKTNDAVFAWVMDTGITHATTGLITDGATTGPGATFRVQAGAIVEDMPMRANFRVGQNFRRTGFCTGTTAARYLGAPCDADGDCPGGACRGESSGSCVESGVNYCDKERGPFDMIRGVFLQSVAATTQPDCFISEVR